MDNNHKVGRNSKVNQSMGGIKVGKKKEYILNKDATMGSTGMSQTRQSIKKISLDQFVLNRELSSKEKFKKVSKIRKHNFRQGFEGPSELTEKEKKQEKEMDKAFNEITKK